MSLTSPEGPIAPLRPAPKGHFKRGLLNEALRLEREVGQKIKRPPQQIPDAAVTGATLLVGGN
jgi:hypothetical protein